MAQTMIWLSYDLGVRGDYAGLYSWLDTRKAKECGDSIAVFAYEFHHDLRRELLADLTASIETNNRTRFYIVYDDPDTGHNKGAFILGRRRASAWTGYAVDGETVDDEIAV